MSGELIGTEQRHGQPLLEVAEIVSGYGLREIVHGASLAVHVQEIVAIIGPNGSGKSTVLKTIMGFLKVWRGQVRFQDRELSRLTPDRIVRRGISFVPQGRPVFPHMTVAEHLDLGAWIVDGEPEKGRARDRVLGLFPRLAERLHQRASTMSGGEQQMLSLARALMLNPSLLILDEPTLGLAPKVVGQIFEKILEINRSGVALLMVEQNAAMALRHSHWGYVLEMGRNRYLGPSQALLQDVRVKRAYLGG